MTNSPEKKTSPSDLHIGISLTLGITVGTVIGAVMGNVGLGVACGPRRGDSRAPRSSDGWCRWAQRAELCALPCR